MNRDLNEGATDGKYKKVSPNRGGFIGSVTQQERFDLKDTWYGIHEIGVKVRPDGKTVSTPEYQSTLSAEPSV